MCTILKPHYSLIKQEKRGDHRSQIVPIGGDRLPAVDARHNYSRSFIGRSSCGQCK